MLLVESDQSAAGNTIIALRVHKPRFASKRKRNPALMPLLVTPTTFLC